MDDIMKIVLALEDARFLLKGVTETIQNETKEQKAGFLGTLEAALGSILLGNLLSGNWRAGSGNKKGKGTVRAGSGNKKGKGIVRAGYGKEWGFCAAWSFNKLWNTKA